MSEKSIQHLFTRTNIELSRLITKELSAPKGFPSERQANDYVRRLFLHYNDLLKKFDQIYSTLCHPQKRQILKILLDALVGRLIELKEELIRFDTCEYTYFEDLALDQNKTLDDIAVEIPRYFAPQRFQAIEERNRTIQTILNRLKSPKEDENEFSETRLITNESFNLAQAVRILQAHERARQGRLHAFLMHRMKEENKQIHRPPSFDDKHCLVIQTIWRQKYAEKLFNQKKFEEEQLLNMILPRERKLIENEKRNLDEIRQEEYEQELIDAPKFLKEIIRTSEGFETKSRLEHILHQWLLESRQLYGQFPQYPTEENQGSTLLFKEMTIDEVQQFVEQQAQALKSKRPKRKQEKKPVRSTKKKQTKQKSIPNQLQASKYLPIINEQLGRYKDFFFERDEFHNREQRYDRLLALEQFRPEVEEELRHDVDQLLREELAYLKLAIDQSEDSTKKKSKSKKKKRKKRTKKVKDPVANRTNESIFEELVETAILLPTKPVRSKDFIGDYQYLTETIRANEKESMPSLLDCQQLLFLHIIFPLSSKEVHLNLPKRKGVLLVGPRGSGKEFLVHIACNELGGLLLDLSPANLVKSFHSAEGLKILLAMIRRLAASMGPVLCLIRDSEILCAKKLTNEEKQLEPKRFQRAIRKLLKKISPGERILFVGLTSKPSRARIKALSQIYEHLILFARPNYASRRKILYTILIEKNQIKITDMELSLLTSISNGYTAGQIIETIDEVLKIKANEKYFSNHFYTAKDFLPVLGLKTPIFVDEERKIQNWYDKTPNGLKRRPEIGQSSKTKKTK